MSTDSFDGGSHGNHDWVPVGHEKVIRSGPHNGETRGHTTILDVYPQHYIIRACSMCTEVWVVPFDFEASIYDPKAGVAA